MVGIILGPHQTEVYTLTSLGKRFECIWIIQLTVPLFFRIFCTPDASFTPHNILTTTSTVNLVGLVGCLGLPVSVYYQIRDNSSYSTEEEKREAMIAYFLNTKPLASWATLAGGLYRKEENVSLEAVRKYLHHNTGQS